MSERGTPLSDQSRTDDGYLTAERVRRTYELCFRNEGPARPNRTTVEGWLLRHTFSVEHLTRERESIIRMLLSLPPQFRADEKGGGSVVAMVRRGDDTYWTEDMSDVEKLVSLGIAVGLVSFCAPRDRWHRLPGGLPYVRVEITRFGVKVN